MLELNRSYIFVIGFLYSVVLAVYFYENYRSKLNVFYLEYQKFKEMKFILNNLSQKSIKNDEGSIRMFLVNNGFNVESIDQVESDFRVVLNKVSPDKLPFLVYKFEESGFVIKSLKYTDNTGLGNGKLVITF
jgi:hypothetical protein